LSKKGWENPWKTGKGKYGKSMEKPINGDLNGRITGNVPN
jgi:hypothetical protein